MEDFGIEELKEHHGKEKNADMRDDAGDYLAEVRKVYIRDMGLIILSQFEGSILEEVIHQQKTLMPQDSR